MTTRLRHVLSILIILALLAPMAASAAPRRAQPEGKTGRPAAARAGPTSKAALASASGPARSSQASSGREDADPASELAASPPSPSSIPAPPAGGPRPTINVSPASGYAGEEVVLSGQGVEGYAGVRLAWVLEDATRVLDVVGTDADNSYEASVAVPSEAVTGTNQICAAVTGTSQAEFACTSFTVETPPPSIIEGSLPLLPGETVQDVDVNLYDQFGNVIVSAGAESDGSFSLVDVPPGDFLLGAVGDLPRLVDTEAVGVSPGSNVINNLPEATCSDARVTKLRADLAARPADNSADWGTYIALGGSGDAVMVTFQADVQYSVAVDHVAFEIERPDGSTESIGSDDQRPYRAQYNVSLLPPGVSTLRARPVPVGGGDGDPCQAAAKTIKVVDNPLDSNFIIGNQISWNGSEKHYTFDGQIPSLGGFLPLVWPDPPPSLPAPLGNELRNEFNAGLLFEADVDLSGRVTFKMLEAALYGEIFSQTVLDKGYGLRSAGVNAVQVDHRDIRSLSVDYGPHTVADYHTQKTLFAGVLFSAVFVDVRVSVKLGLNGRLVLEGTIQPLMPAFDTTLTAVANPKLIGTLAVDAKVARLEGRLIPSILLSVPLLIRTTAKPYVDPQTPCLIFRFDVEARVRVINPNPFQGGWNTIWSERKNVVDEHQPPDCSPPGMAKMAAVAPPAARVLPSPDVATAPTGQVLQAYVKDDTPDDADATSVIAVRFQDPGADFFGPEIELTSGDGSRDVYGVSDPAVTFAGQFGEAIAAWTETVITEGEAEGMTGAPEEIMAHQEIAYAFYDGADWTVPQRITDDEIPDGMADIDGDLNGATLAWVKDTGGVLSDTSHIAVTQWDLGSGSWLSPVELNAYLDNDQAMNHQVSVDRKEYAGGETYNALAWTADEDGDLSTPDDRYISLATEGTLFGQPFWFAGVLTETEGLPAGVDSPSIGMIDPQTNGYERLDLAFLKRGGVTLDGDTVDLGQVSNQAEVWMMSKYPGEGWLGGPMTDGSGDSVVGEAPQIFVSDATELSSQETLVAFRRFGDAAGVGLVGEMAVSRNGSSPLLYTLDLNQHWLPALAVDPVSRDALLVNVSQSFDLLPMQRAKLEHKLASVDAEARPSAQRSAFSAAQGSLVETIRIDPQADPALDPGLKLSQQHASAGATVEMTATVRNLGRAPTGDLTVEFYDGDPATGTLVGTRDPGLLFFNESALVSAAVTASGGDQTLTARLVVESGGDFDTTNNEAAADLGAIPAPTTLDVQPSSQDLDALMLSWVAPPVPGIAGYRVLRSTSSGGPYELIGETTTPFFTDGGLTSDTAYYYVVQAYDAAGVRSPFSGEAMEGLPSIYEAYIPTVLRDEG